MGIALERLIETWDGLAVISKYDPPSDAWMFIALHNNQLGVPVGGTRLKVYAGPEDGLKDAMRLAEGMTHKWASINLSFGGGKAVLALSRELEPGRRKGLFRRYGSLLKALNGSFIT